MQVPTECAFRPDPVVISGPLGVLSPMLFLTPFHLCRGHSTILFLRPARLYYCFDKVKVLSACPPDLIVECIHPFSEAIQESRMGAFNL